MPSSGGYAPSPVRYGGGTPLTKTIHDALNAQMGTGIDVSVGSYDWCVNFALARMLWEVWETNQRLANQNDPDRMTTTLPRWERILGLSPLPTDTDVDRRARVKLRFQRLAEPSLLSRLTSELTTALGPVFVQIVSIPLANALVHWPGGTPNAATPWYSTVSHLLVKLQKPAGYSEGQFYQAAATVFPILDELCPPWMTFDWYRNGPGHTGSWTTDPGAGFYLDETNLDNEVFDG